MICSQSRKISQTLLEASGLPPSPLQELALETLEEADHTQPAPWTPFVS